MAAVVNYSPPWWVNLLHRLPHFNMEFQIVSSDFRPEDSEYQKVRQVRGNNYLLLRIRHPLCIMQHQLLPPAHTVISQQSGQTVAMAVLKELWSSSLHRSMCVDRQIYVLHLLVSMT